MFWSALVLLIVLHHDWWFWHDGSLIFGFLPIGLAYHALLSLVAGGLWAWTAFVIMPEVFQDDAGPPPPRGDRRAAEHP